MNPSAAKKLGKRTERAKHLRPYGKRRSAKSIRRALRKELP